MFCLLKLTFLAYEQRGSSGQLCSQLEHIARRADARCAAQTTFMRGNVAQADLHDHLRRAYNIGPSQAPFDSSIDEATRDILEIGERCRTREESWLNMNLASSSFIHIFPGTLPKPFFIGF